MGDIYRAMGKLDWALDQYGSYRKVSEQLVALEKPNIPNWAWRLDLWISHQRIGDILLAQGDATGALKEYKDFQQWAQEVVRLDSEHGEWERFFANSCLEVGDALLALGKIDEALTQFARAKKEYEQLANQDHRPRSQRSLAIAHQRLGLARLAKNDVPHARDEFAACAAIKIDESAQDGQITVPALVHKDCENRLGFSIHLCNANE